MRGKRRRRDSSSRSDSRKQASETRPQEAQRFCFVTYTGDECLGADVARKKIRAQAARASASNRIETIERRRDTRRESTALSSQSGNSSDIGQDNGPQSSVSSTPRASSRTSSPSPGLSKHTSLTITPHRHAVTVDWKCGLPNLIEECFERAVVAVYQWQIPCDLRSLSQYFASPVLYNDPLMIQCLKLLAVSTDGSYSISDGSSRPVTVWLWHQLTITIQAALLESESNFVVAAVVSLLAGWEWQYGEGHTFQSQLTHLSRLVPGASNREKLPKLPDQASVSCLPAPNYLLPLPPGFEFYKVNNLLPTCLMNIVGSLSHLDPNVPGELVKIRRTGIAAMACRRVSTTVPETSAAHDASRQIAIHVRTAAGLLSTMMQIEGNDQPSDSVEEELATWYSEMGTMHSDQLIGTVYDDILLWCLCVFSASSGQKYSMQPRIIQNILDGYRIQKWEKLKHLLSRYVCPPSLFQRLQRSSIDLM